MPMNNPPRPIKALGEVVLRARNLEAMQEFYEKTVGLEVLEQFENMVFFQIGPGYAGTDLKEDHVLELLQDFEAHRLLVELLHGLQVSCPQHDFAKRLDGSRGIVHWHLRSRSS